MFPQAESIKADKGPLAPGDFWACTVIPREDAEASVLRVPVESQTIRGGMMNNQIRRFLKEESGQDLVEYALLLFLVLAVAIATIKAVGGKVSSVFSAVLSFLT